jgi:hypothetical protein
MHGKQIVYARTPLGDTELMARRSDLGPALNSLLVLVNGQRTQEDLMTVVARFDAPTNSISRLETGGYIQRLGAAGLAFAVAPADSVNGAATPTDAKRRVLLYQHMIGAVREHLGMKGVFFHLKVEKATTLEDYLALLDPLGNAIAKAQGVDTANAFLKVANSFIGD